MYWVLSTGSSIGSRFNCCSRGYARPLPTVIALPLPSILLGHCLGGLDTLINIVEVKAHNTIP